MVEIFLVIFLVIVAIAVIFYLLSRKSYKNLGQQQAMIEKSKTTVSIYIIDKKKAKFTDANFPKAIIDKVPRFYKWMKMPLVKAKIGSQISTLMCDRRVFDALPVKKTVKVDLAGLYIADMKGLKSEYEIKQIRKAKKLEMLNEKKQSLKNARQKK